MIKIVKLRQLPKPIHKNILPGVCLFFIGFLISGYLAIVLTTKAIIKIQEGDTLSNNLLHPSYKHALQDYEDAQKLWPFLRYNPSFIAKITDVKTKLQSLNEEPSIIIYLKDKIKDTEREQFIRALRITSLQRIREIRYVSQEDALSKYREQNKNDPLLLELATADIFPASIEVYLTDQTVKNKIVIFAQSKTFVDRVITSPRVD